MFSSMKHKMHCANYKLGKAPGRVNTEMSRDIKKRECASADKRLSEMMGVPAVARVTE